MPNFGKYAVMDPVTHYFEQEPDWFWKIKPVAGEEELSMTKFLAHRRVLTTIEGTVEMPPTWMEVCLREIALSFGGTNIPAGETPIEKGGEALLADDATVEQIETALKAFPRSMLMEVWRAVGEAYPYWGPSNPNAR
jgi:hypothetical protein